MGHFFNSSFGSDPNNTPGYLGNSSANNARLAAANQGMQQYHAGLQNSTVTGTTALPLGYVGTGSGYVFSSQQSVPPPVAEAVHMTESGLSDPVMLCDLSVAKDMWAVRFGAEWVRRNAFKDDSSYMMLCYRLMLGNELEEVYLYDCRDYSYKLKR